MTIVSHAMLTYERGGKLFRSGKPCPPKPADDCDGTEPHALLWIGYRTALALDWMKRRDVARALNMPDPEING